jgi:hypothetical protein
MPTNRASMKVSNRAAALSAYVTANNIVIPQNNRMSQLTARFSSFANTVQTRLNESNGSGSGLGGTLEAQVDRALSQVLRQPAGSSATAVAVDPKDTGVAALVRGTGGALPAMSPYQATMLREGRITQADSLSIIDTLQPLSPFTDPGDAAAIQAVVQAEINGLLDEFSYTRLLPRKQRVRVFLGGLLGWNYDNYITAAVTSPLQTGAPTGDVQLLVNLLNLGGPLIPTISVEDQLASQQVLASDSVLFDSQWTTFSQNTLVTYWQQLLASLGVVQGNWASYPSWSLWEPQLLKTTNPGGLGSLFPSTGGAVPALIALGPQSPQLPVQAQLRVGVVDNLPTSSGPPPFSLTGLSYAEKMIQADLLRPVIAQDASRVEDSLAAVGYSSGEQETTFAWFWSAVDADQLPAFGGAATLPSPPVWTVLNSVTNAKPTALTPIPVYMTVADILDWAQELAGQSSSDQLRNAGALGLNLLCDQADELFWLALAMLDQMASTQIPALADSEVQLEVASLATDLNTFANLAY